MKIREKINILLSLLISLLGVTSCQHTKSAAKNKPDTDSKKQEQQGRDSEIMLMYGVPAPEDISIDSLPQLQDKPQQQSIPQQQRPQIMVKYGVPPQFRK